MEDEVVRVSGGPVSDPKDNFPGGRENHFS